MATGSAFNLLLMRHDAHKWSECHRSSLAVVNLQLLHGGDLRVALSEDRAGEFRWYNK